MRNYRFPLRCKWNRGSSVILRSGEWKFRTDVSGQLIGTIFKGQTTWPLKMEFVGCPKTSERNYHSTLRTVASSMVKYTTWPLKMGFVGCPKTSERNYHPTLRRIPEEGRSAARLSLQRPAALTKHFCTHLNIGFDDTQFVLRASVIAAITTIAYRCSSQTLSALLVFQQYVTAPLGQKKYLTLPRIKQLGPNTYSTTCPKSFKE
jgi:hypothetical protein